jgi:DNA-binding transcriptional regulator LsrR (DeoR family)
MAVLYEKGITQQAIADKYGVSLPHISRFIARRKTASV